MTIPRLALLLAAGAAFAAPARAGYSNGQSASAAIGQANFTFSGVNGTPGIGASGYFQPASVASDGTVLIVADTANNRVLIYNSVPTSNGVPTDVVVGQPDSVSRVANQGGSPAANTLSAPTGVYFDGATLYVADTGNNRVLIYYGLPNANNIPADVVVGQPSFTAGAANQGGGAYANTLSGPQGVYSDGVSLVVADTGNNRVLLFNAVPTGPNVLADVVVGQSTTTAKLANAGTVTGAYTLSAPAAARKSGTSLFVADRGNNRVLIYSPVPAVNAASATVAVGQLFLTSGAANMGASVSSMTLSAPSGVDTDGTRLIVSDAGNNRVLVFNAIPAVSGVGANAALGQTTLKAGLANQGASKPSSSTLSGPAGVAFDGTRLCVADRVNNRALIYGPLPAASGAAAVNVEGQSDFVSAAANQSSGGPSASTLARPNGLWTDGVRLAVADRSNNRILLYSSQPKASGAAADVVVGQVLFSSGGANRGGSPTAATLSGPSGVFTDATRMIVADTANNRVLVYSPLPAVNGAAAGVVVGQGNLSSSAVNQGGAPTAKTLSQPVDVFADGTGMYVADRANNRVLVYASVPAVNNAPAAFVLGQAAATTNGANQGGLGASSLSAPTGVSGDGARLYVADQLNHRVLIYNLPIAANGAAAAVVVGQANMTSNAANRGLSAPTNATLQSPGGVRSDGTSLYVMDTGNNRLLIYTPIPTANGAAASAVIGQSSFTTRSVNQGLSVGPATLANPASVCVDSATGRMYLSDTLSNRALLFLPSVTVPVSASGASAVLASPLSPTLTRVVVPPGVLPAGASLTVQVQTGLAGPASPARTAAATGIAVLLLLDQGVQPSGPLAVSLTFLPQDVAGLSLNKLVIARYDDASGVWVPQPTVVDAGNSRVTAQASRLGLFQLIQIDPQGNDLTTVRVYPNPFQPSAGHAAMIFASLSPGGRVRVYTLTGALVKDMFADANGIARWDGTNAAGAAVASGVYYAFVQADGGSRLLNVAVQK